MEANVQRSEPERRKLRRSRFKALCHIDGKNEATVTIEETVKGQAVVRVRPLRGRSEYALSIGTVAEMVASRCVKDNLAAMASKPGGRRRVRRSVGLGR